MMCSKYATVAGETRLEQRQARVAQLPTGAELLSAIRNHFIGTHPLNLLANKLGTIHRLSLKHTSLATIDAERLSLIAAIDGWASDYVAALHRPIALRYETFGALIDALADSQVRAYHLLMNGDPADPMVHAAWHRLAEQVHEYSALLSTVGCGDPVQQQARDHAVLATQRSSEYGTRAGSPPIGTTDSTDLSSRRPSSVPIPGS
ncbi:MULTISPECIES: hypothetical protein [Nocardia]|nr:MULTISPECIES: hypothetical protein [Nocardia]MBF6278731.1 hypothetical protein [Nocardia nova]